MMMSILTISQQRLLGTSAAIFAVYYTTFSMCCISCDFSVCHISLCAVFHMTFSVCLSLQMKLLMSKREASVPLFLSLACEELRVFGLFDKVCNMFRYMSHGPQTLMRP